mmetsp:Transcript_1280/g.1542  ORF Transcript_1280/g.1542 Transcript_1280/m.1542 type:complete len:175 (+) Transcript_1280:250-774(+)
MSTKTFHVFSSMFLPLLRKLEKEYWSIHCGVDGYLYLLFQRRFISLTWYMTIVSVVSQILLWISDKDYNFTFFGLQQDQEEDLSKKKPTAMDLISGLYSNQLELSTQKAWTSICIIFIFTLLTINMVQKTRKDAKIALEDFNADMSRYKDQECLKARTLHIKGVLPLDRSGEGL